MSRINFMLSWVEHEKFYNLGGQLLCKVIYSSGGHFVLQSRTGLTILVAGLMRNICVKWFEFSGPAVHFGAILSEVLIWIWASSFRCHLKTFNCAWQSFCLVEQNQFVNLKHLKYVAVWMSGLESAWHLVLILNHCLISLNYRNSSQVLWLWLKQLYLNEQFKIFLV